MHMPYSCQSIQQAQEIERLAYNETENKNTIEAYEEFLTKFPKSKHFDEATFKLEKLYYDKAEAQNTIEDYENFLVKYPKGNYSNEIKSKKKVLNFKKEQYLNQSNL